MNQMLTKVLGRDILQLKAHEVTGVERIIIPDLTIFTAVKQGLDFVGPSFHHGKFLFLL
ncbi:hypothetical protein D3C85_1714270 [compost metagenome]